MSSKGSRASKASSRLPPPAAGPGAQGALRRATPGQDQLQDEGLLEAEASLRGTDLGVVVGPVGQAQRRHDVEHVVLAAQLGGEHVGDPGHQVER